MVNLNIVNWDEMDLNYEGENKFASFFSSTGNIHTYPAKAVPEMVNDLIKKIMSISSIQTVLDPFVGSGTTALEAKYLGLDFYGSDLNPLAVLLSRTKSLTIHNTNYIKKQLNDFIAQTKKDYKEDCLIVLESFDSIEFWFKDENILELSYLKMRIDRFLKQSKKYRETYALILLTAFSSTIRRVSLTRNGEFKLYRMSPNDIERFSINAIDKFEDAINNLLDMLVVANDSYEKDTSSCILMKNAKNIDYLDNETIDLIITSPPYGDSKTTVAYGEFSKLSLEWLKTPLKKYLDINIESCNCDEMLLGGRKSEWKLEDEEGFYSSAELNNLVLTMDKRIKNKKEELTIAENILNILVEKYEESHVIDVQLLKSNELLYHLISERIRLDIYRKINSSLSGMSNKTVKKKAKEQRNICLHQLVDPNVRKYMKRQQMVFEKLEQVRKTINRNYKSIEKRKNEVIIFLKDLYMVVLETDRVMKKQGFQVWIVGHRTVMGNIVINMEGILKEWFINHGYGCEASLSRKYSFKRMPHHINSTIERDQEVNTMMNEYILVVRKVN